MGAASRPSSALIKPTSSVPIIIATLLIVVAIVSCSTLKDADKTTTTIDTRQDYNPPHEVSAMRITSPAFKQGDKIPMKYTCDGDEHSPELHIADIAQNAKSLALIMDDPDAPGGTFVHWVMWNIPATTTSIPEGESPEGFEGNSSFRKKGYGGPCPPSGVHRYFFRIYALDSMLSLPEGATRQQLDAAMKGHIIANAELMVTYSRT